jgi:hypothetical protein
MNFDFILLVAAVLAFDPVVGKGSVQCSESELTEVKKSHQTCVINGIQQVNDFSFPNEQVHF